MKQARIDSLMEAVTNTLIGFVVSLATQLILVRLYHVEISFSTSIQFVGWFTVVSVARQYVLRRLFDGRTVWQSIRDKWL
jgi:hypothetical protein